MKIPDAIMQNLRIGMTYETYASLKSDRFYGWMFQRATVVYDCDVLRYLFISTPYKSAVAYLFRIYVVTTKGHGNQRIHIID